MKVGNASDRAEPAEEHIDLAGFPKIVMGARVGRRPLPAAQPEMVLPTAPILPHQLASAPSRALERVPKPIA